MSKSTTGPSRSARPATKNPSTTRRPVRTGAARPRPAAAAFRSRHPVLAALVPVGLVVAAIATMVVIKVTAGSGPSSAAAASHLTAQGSATTVDPGTSPLSASVLASLSVSPATLDAVGSPGSVALPSRVGDGAVGRGADGKPEITYIGAEYCPYCAAERWALAVALTRFGTFSNLSGTHSSGADVFPDTQTLSFYGASYSSTYLDFQAVEEATNQEVDGTYQALQTPTAAESSLLATDDPEGSIPFLDIGNTYVITGASYSPQVLQGLSRTQIAAQLNDPSSPVGQAIDGTANNLTAAICEVTGNQPASVCNAPAIAAIAKKMGS